MNNDVTRTVLHGFALCKQGGCLSGCILAFHVTSPVQQNLLVAKSRIAPTDFDSTEIVAAHTLGRLMNHAKEVLKDQRIDNYHF